MRAFKVCPGILFALVVVGLAYAQDEMKRSETEFMFKLQAGPPRYVGWITPLCTLIGKET
jgi:hypothetical protein